MWRVTLSVILLVIIMASSVLGLGIVNRGDVADPIPCSGLTTFEEQGTYLRDVYVSPSGSDSGDGSNGNPYRTLTRAAQNAQPGDIIHLAAGTYNGGIQISDLRGTTQNPIQITGPAGGSAVISGGANCIRFSRPRYLVVRNIECRGGSSNGINCDDGGDYDNRHAAEYVKFDNIEIRDIGSGGNQDCLKLSGVNNFYVLNSNIHDGSSGGSGIDMVGCHDGIIMGNEMRNLGSNFIQTKGGTEDITIHGNLFDGVTYRGVNMGGGTGAEYFRPPLSQMPSGGAYEARHIRTTSNIFLDVNSAVAYVGCDECLAANNIIYKPRTWVLRILQESTAQGGYTFLPSRRGEFVNNIVVFDQSTIRSFINIGSNTAPETFRFANNLWYCDDNENFNYGASAASLPTAEVSPLRQVNPLFANPGNEDFTMDGSSPAYGNGESGWVNTDFVGNCFTGDEIGAFARAGGGPVCKQGDLNCDGSVDIFDLVLVAQNFGMTQNFDERADANDDGQVDIFDLVVVAQNFG